MLSTTGRATPQEPLIAVIGATGTGKSQLAVELAKQYNGEVINGDAMQLYQGLPLITNKITVEEQQGIPHHLLGCIGLREQAWVVGTFVQKALEVIEEIRNRGKVPILVGGTHYYLQSLLFTDKLAGGQDDQPFVKDPTEQWPILQQDTATLLTELRMVDPVMADRWHPNDRRKIQRSLEIYLKTGKKASDMYAEQRQIKNGREFHGPPLRFPTLLLWIHATSDALNPRLDKRVEKMLENGLLSEVRTLDAFGIGEAAEDRAVDDTRGIWVSIGYKEFKEYSRALDSDQIDDKALARLRTDALEKTKIATRQYAKRQMRWIRIKLLNSLQEVGAKDTLYLLDGSDVSTFDTAVVQTATNLAHSFLTVASQLPDPRSLSTTAEEMLTPTRDHELSARPEKWLKKHCEMCDVTCVTEDQWRMHMKSKAHRKLAPKCQRLDVVSENQRPVGS